MIDKTIKYKNFISFSNWLKESSENSLFEVGEANVKPYLLEKRSFGEYRFETEDGDKYVIHFLNGFWNNQIMAYVSFFTSKKLNNPEKTDYIRVINKGKIFRILPTVINAIKLFIKDYKKDVKNGFITDPLQYIGIVPAKNDINDDRRLNIYQAYIKKLLPGIEIIKGKKETGEDVLIIKSNKSEFFSVG